MSAVVALVVSRVMAFANRVVTRELVTEPELRRNLFSIFVCDTLSGTIRELRQPPHHVRG